MAREYAQNEALCKAGGAILGNFNALALYFTILMIDD